MFFGSAVLSTAAHAYQAPALTCTNGPALCGRPDANGDQGTCADGFGCFYSLFGTSSCTAIMDPEDQCARAGCEDDETQNPLRYCSCIKKTEFEAMFCAIEEEEEEVDTCPPSSLCGRIAEILRQRIEAELAAANRII